MTHSFHNNQFFSNILKIPPTTDVYASRPHFPTFPASWFSCSSNSQLFEASTQFPNREFSCAWENAGSNESFGMSPFCSEHWLRIMLRTWVNVFQWVTLKTCSSCWLLVTVSSWNLRNTALFHHQSKFPPAESPGERWLLHNFCVFALGVLRGPMPSGS